MDLFFINPKYFFGTYFSFSKRAFLIIFFSTAIIVYLLLGRRFKKKSMHFAFVVLSALYAAVLLGITLFNLNRGQVQQSHLNPLFNIQDMFSDTGVHQIRGCVSNILLFIPCGAFTSIFFMENKFRNSVIVATVISIAIEALQFSLRRGCAETMDVICNVLGAVIGSLITIRILKTIDYFNIRYKE